MYKKAQVKWREESNGIIIFCPRRSRIFKLNSTASEIWKMLNGKSLQEIAEHISKTYSISIKEASADVKECLNDLINKELVIESN